MIAGDLSPPLIDNRSRFTDEEWDLYLLKAAIACPEYFSVMLRYKPHDGHARMYQDHDDHESPAWSDEHKQMQKRIGVWPMTAGDGRAMHRAIVRLRSGS